MTFWQRRRDAPVEPGAIFCRTEKGKIVETAHVLSIAPDRGGIPHVRFLLRKERGYDGAPDEPRTLALERFRALFPDRSAS